MAETTDGTQTRPDDDMTIEGGVQPTDDLLRRSPLSDADERPRKRAKTGVSELEEIATAMSLAQSHFDSDFGHQYQQVDTFPLLHSRRRHLETREDLIAYGQRPPELDNLREIEPMRRTRRVRRKIVHVDDPSPQTPTALDSVLGEVKVQIENVGTNVTKILRDMSDIREGIQAEEIKGAEILHAIEDLRKASTTSTVGKEIDARLTALEEGQKEIKLLLNTLQEAVHPSDPVAVSRTRGRTGSDDSQDVNPVDDAPPGEETE